MLALTKRRAALSAHSSDYPQLASRNSEHDLTTLQLPITARLTKRALQMEHEAPTLYSVTNVFQYQLAVFTS